MRNIVLIAFILVLAHSNPAASQVSEVTVRVDGLSCPFCAYSLEKNLKHIDGVEELVIDIKLGTATLVPVKGEGVVDLASIPTAVSDAGFTPRGVSVIVAGIIEGQGDEAVLIAPGGTHLFRLEVNEVFSSAKIEIGKTYDIVGDVVASNEEGDDSGLALLALTEISIERAGE